MRRLLLALLLALQVTAADAALLFDGVNDCAQSASTLDLSAHSKVAVSIWLYWDAFDTGFDIAFETDGTTGAFNATPDWNTGVFGFGVNKVGGEQGYKSFTRPSAAAWHHYVFNYDIAATADAMAASAFIDAASQSLSNLVGSSTAGTVFGNLRFDVMARNCASLFGTGRAAEIAIYGGIHLSQTDVDNLYNSGSGALATTVQSGSLAHYWKMCSDGTATTGGINLTVTGATETTHPIGTCSTAVPRRRVIQW